MIEPARHDPPNNNRQIVGFLQSTPPPHRAHPMDTLSLAMAPSTIETVPPPSSAHIDGVWVAPPEQNIRQPAPMTSNFSHTQPQRPTSNFDNRDRRVRWEELERDRSLWSISLNLDEHMHDYSHQPGHQQTYLPNRLDDRSQAPNRPGYPSS